MLTAPLSFLVVAAVASVLFGSRVPVALAGQESETHPETVAERFQALRSLGQAEKQRADHALETGLAFCLALGVGDGAQAKKLIDAVGYQALPEKGELPLDAARPIAPAEIARRVERLPDSGADAIAATHFRLLDRDATAELFPAVAVWMLPRDYALICEPDRAHPRWVQRAGCSILRSRGGRVSVVGGNLFSVLGDDDPTSTSPASLETDDAN
jgi:hypothetical protein